MFRIPFVTSALLAIALAIPATAQVQVFGGNGPRMASTRIFWNNGPVGMVCVQYGQPDWKAEYDTMVEKAKGQQLRLGKDFWTTLNTSVPLTIAGVEVPAGSFYLGLKCDDAGAFHLLVMGAEKADKAGWAPFVADAWKADHTCALKMSKSDESAEKLMIEFGQEGDDPTVMTFSVHWGTHMLTAPVTAHIATPKKDAKSGK